MKIAVRFVMTVALAFGATLTGTMRPSAAARHNAQAPSSESSQPVAGNGQTVTPLPDGRVLVAGGDANGTPIATARIIDPVTGRTTDIALPVPRAHHTATVLADGSVLIAGGIGANGQPVSIPDVFDPSTGAFSSINIAGATARADASATLLTDGRVLIVGGEDVDGEAPGAEIWDLAHNTATTLPSAGATPRKDHTATLMPDGRVLVANGEDASGHPRSDADLVDPVTGTFTPAAPLPSSDVSPPVVMATTPADGAQDVPEHVRIAVRFSKALNIATLAHAMQLSNQDGALPVGVVPAEHGRLAFVTPGVALAPATQYALLIDGATDDRGVALSPTTITFTTRDDQHASDPSAVDTEPWVPNGADPKNGWRTNRGQSPWQTLKPLMAPDGVTAIAGQVLRLDGRPLAHVTLEVNGQDTRTDGTGRFLLLLPGLGSGHQELGIDGRTANRPNRTYGTFEYGLNVVAGRTTVLPFTIWMPLIDTLHQVTIASPTLSETVITTPYIPGLELHLPSGTVIKDDDGKVVRTVSISPIPVDRPPFPLPNNSDVPIYFTIQPGGAYIAGDWSDPKRGAWLVYPNYRREFPGKRIQFYQYDPEKIGWHVYGVGTVTPNGRQVTPDPTTRLWAFTGAMINSGPAPPADGAPPGDCPACANGGDPVNLATGLFSLEQTDLSLPDTLPIAVTRSYRTRDPEVRPFGPGTTYPYAMFLWSAHQYTEADLVLPDGAKIHYVRTSGGVSFADAVFQHVETATTSATPTAFYKSTIVWNGNGWNLTLLDGTVYVFGENAPLQAIRDKYGNTITITHAAGQAGNVTQVTSPHGRWIAFTYGEDTNCGSCISHITDNIGRTVHYAYDTNGNLWKVTDPLGHVTEYTYDSSHNMLTVKNRNGVVYVTNEYTAAADAPTPVGWVKTQTHADTGIFRFAYTVSNGESTQTDVTDPRGFIRRVMFNADGYSLSETTAYGQPEAQTTTSDRPSTSNFVATATDSLNAQVVYARDDLGNVTAVTRCLANQSPCSETSPGALTTHYTYDPHFQQVATITDPLQHTTTYAYDAAGNLTSITDPLQHQTTFVYNSIGQLTSTTDALQHTTTFGYTGGDLTTVTDPLNRITTRFFDAAGRLLAVTDPQGQTTRYSYDANDQVQTLTDALGGQTTFAYFPEGQVQSVMDANQHTTDYTYDVMGRLASRADSLARTETFTYDQDGNPYQWTDRKGQITTWVYDALGRVHQITYNAGSTLNYTYDGRDRLTEVDDSASGSITRTYDDFNRLTSETTAEGSIGYTYDDADRRATMTIAGQPPVVYNYDDADRLTGMTRDTLNVSMTYDAANRRSTLTLPNGIVTTYGYDNAGQLTSLSYQSGATALGDLSYTYDSEGRRVEATGSLARTGLPRPRSAATYDAANQLTSVDAQAFSYDSDGNVASDGLTTYTWNDRNQLGAMSGAVTASFEYDALGRRRSRTTPAGDTKFLYDDLGVAQELTGAGAVTANLLIGPRIDEVFAEASIQGTSVPLVDGLGSTIEATDTNAGLEVQFVYDPFGVTTATGNTVVDIAQFTGRENDAGTALYYFRARYYAPTIDRFISQDPARSDWNLYTYAQSDPVTLTDPLGLKPGDPYPSVDAAAVAALQEFNPRSIQVDAEIGGSIYCDGSQYKYTVPNIQIVYSDFVRSSRPPAGKKRVGDYHTHGRHGNIGLSSQDKANADALRIPFYLGTPIGSIIKYDPKIGIQVTLPFLTRVPK